LTDKKRKKTEDEDSAHAATQRQEAGPSVIPNLGKNFVEAQMDLVRNVSMGQAEAFRGFLNSMQAFTNFGAVFKTTVQKAGRISIPEAERAALGINEGDLVQVVILPLRRNEKE